jgi:hypothetical protein
MFCPKCRYEYKEGITVCPDCDEPLVAQLTPTTGAAAMPDETWVGVCTVNGGVSAEMAKGALDSNNIPSAVVSGGFTGHGTGMSHSDGLTALTGRADVIMVPRQYREMAQVVLEAVLGEGYEGIEDYGQ